MIDKQEFSVILDRDQFASRYHEFLPRVLNYLRARVGDETLAEELTASTFAQAFAKREQLRSEAAFPGWLFRIAHNELAQHFRRQSTRGATPASFDFLGDVPSDEAAPDEIMSQRQQTQEILVALHQLATREQEILELKFVAGLSNIEIADVVGLTPSNVGVLIFRALRRLRSTLDEMGLTRA